MVKVIGVNAFFKAVLNEEAIHVNNCFVSKASRERPFFSIRRKLFILKGPQWLKHFAQHTHSTVKSRFKKELNLQVHPHLFDFLISKFSKQIFLNPNMI